MLGRSDLAGLRGPVQWWILWVAHAQFIAGITGLVRNDAGHVLLLRHRFWPPQHQWGLPTGYAKRREAVEATIVREVKEETDLDVTVGSLLHLTSSYQLRIEVAYAAQLVGGELKLDSLEVLEAGWFPVTELPAGTLPAHRQLIQANAARGGPVWVRPDMETYRALGGRITPICLHVGPQS